MGLLRALPPALRPTRQWVPIGIPEEQRLVDVRLQARGFERDVTRDHVIVSLRPLLIGVSREAAATDGGAQLRFHDRAEDTLLGSLVLRVADDIETSRDDLRVYRPCEWWHRCLPAPMRAWQRGLRLALRMRHAQDNHLGMSRDDIQQMLIFYVCPRPVVLVSVDDGENDNLFPMDLIGPIGDRFSLALRTTSPSVATMQKTRRVALADMPHKDVELVYRLGAHHRQSRIRWEEQPFQTIRSTRFSLRVPELALRVREYQIESDETIGSHTLFAGRIVSEQRRGTGPRLFHTSGIHCEYRSRCGGFAWSDVGSPS